MFLGFKEKFKSKFKALSRYIALRILPFLVAQIIRILLLLLRIKVEASPKALEEISKNEPLCVAFWHGELLLQPYVVRNFFRDRQLFAMISQHFDGEIIAKVMKFFKIQSIRGSSSKGGIKAFLEAIKALKENGVVSISPDGPRGPYHSIADGIILLAQKSNTKILISRIICENAWEFKSWDKFKIPKPFSKVTFAIKGPLDIKELSQEEAKELLKSEMEKE